MKEQKELMKKLKKDYDDFLFMASGLNCDHQLGLKAELNRKAINIKEQIVQLEQSLKESDVPTKKELSDIYKLAHRYNFDDFYQFMNQPPVENTVVEPAITDKMYSDTMDALELASKMAGKTKRVEPVEDKTEKHETCDGCQMFQECGCMLDVSVCPDCWEHDQWTPKEQSQPVSTKSAEEKNRLIVKRIDNNQLVKVRKYIIDNEGEEYIWSDDWYGKHVIGKDCEWESQPDREVIDLSNFLTFYAEKYEMIFTKSFRMKLVDEYLNNKK